MPHLSLAALHPDAHQRLVEAVRRLDLVRDFVRTRDGQTWEDDVLITMLDDACAELHRLTRSVEALAH